MTYEAKIKALERAALDLADTPEELVRLLHEALTRCTNGFFPKEAQTEGVGHGLEDI